jgi:hypothetical protein
MANSKTLPILLRAIANTKHAKDNQHDVIFYAAANLIEFQSDIINRAKDLVRALKEEDKI